MIGVLVSRLMSSAGESSSTSTSATPAEGVPPPPMGAPRENIPTTPLTPASQVVLPPASTNVVGTSSGVVTGILGVSLVSISFAHTAQSCPVGSSSFF